MDISLINTNSAHIVKVLLLWLLWARIEALIAAVFKRSPIWGKQEKLYRITFIFCSSGIIEENSFDLSHNMLQEFEENGPVGYLHEFLFIKVCTMMWRVT